MAASRIFQVFFYMAAVVTEERGEGEGGWAEGRESKGLGEGGEEWEGGQLQDRGE